MFYSFTVTWRLGHPHRLETLGRTLVVIAAMTARLAVMLLAVVAMMLRPLAVRATWRRIAVARIDAGFGRARGLAIGLLLARMRCRVMRGLAAMAAIRSAAPLARLGMRMRVAVVRLARTILAVAIPLPTMAMLLRLLALGLRVGAFRTLTVTGLTMTGLTVAGSVRMRMIVARAARLIGADAILAAHRLVRPRLRIAYLVTVRTALLARFAA